MLFRETISVSLITMRNIYYVGKSCRFFMLIGVTVTAELDDVRET